MTSCRQNCGHDPALRRSPALRRTPARRPGPFGLFGALLLLATTVTGCGAGDNVTVAPQPELQCRTLNDETDDIGATDVDPLDLVSTTVARGWNEAAVAAIRLDDPEPTVHARNLYHLSAVMWEVWVGFQPDAAASELFGAAPSVSVDGDVDQARAQALHAAAFTLLSSRYRNAVGASEIAADLTDTIVSWCGPSAPQHVFNPVAGSAAAYGVAAAEAIMAASIDDGSLERSDYEDVSYQAANEPLIMSSPDQVAMADPSRWQPLSLDVAISQNGIPQPAGPQLYIGPQWGSVTGFALNQSGESAGTVEGLPIDPGPPPEVPSELFFHELLTVLEASAQLAEGQATVDIAPEGTNPATGSAYEPNVVDRADYGRIIAEYWADGPESETPPGHWNVLANKVTDQLVLSGPLVMADGTEVDQLEWDVKLYVALNGALHDAAIAAWGTKRHYDYVRPISAIRHFGALDQLPETPGLVETITAESAGTGQRHAHLADHVGRQAVLAWSQPEAGSNLQPVGAAWMLPKQWVPYQRPTFVTPSFPGYVSGHSTFSRAGAELLTAFTGSAHFPGGLATHTVGVGSLRHEIGPSEEVELQWGTYQEAADEAGVSRIWGGIHVPADDVAGRQVGADVGRAAWDRAQALFAESK